MITLVIGLPSLAVFGESIVARSVLKPVGYGLLAGYCVCCLGWWWGTTRGLERSEIRLSWREFFRANAISLGNGFLVLATLAGIFVSVVSFFFVPASAFMLLPAFFFAGLACLGILQLILLNPNDPA